LRFIEFIPPPILRSTHAVAINLADRMSEGVKLETSGRETFSSMHRHAGNIQAAIVRRSKAAAYATNVMPIALLLKIPVAAPSSDSVANRLAVVWWI